MKPLTRHLSAVYCDDVRQEVNGKFTLVGVYNHVCIVDSFPATIASLCVMLNFVTPADIPLLKAGYKAWLGSDLVADVPLADLQQADLQQKECTDKALGPLPDGIESAGSFFSTTAFLRFQMLNLEKSCTLRVRAYADDGEEYPSVGLVFLERSDLSVN